MGNLRLSAGQRVLTWPGSTIRTRQRERRHTVLRVTEVEDEYSSVTREAAPKDEQDAFDRLWWTVQAD